MIEIYKDDWCDNCSEFEPVVEKETYYANVLAGKCTEKHNTTVECIHRQRCRCLVEYLREEI